MPPLDMPLSRTCGLVIAVFLLALPRVGVAQPAPPLLSTAFHDQAVFQREAPIPVWGTAGPGDTVTLGMAGATATAEVDSAGHWSAQLPAPAPGGPYTLEARSTGGARQTLEDVLVGDVFLCSGQSNMVLPVSRALNAPTEVRNASNERIRMATIPQVSSAAPQEALPEPIHWEAATPETVSDWSAACYYFARDLQQYVDVPLGLINSSWGGSQISAWMSQEALASLDGNEESLALLQRYAEDEGAAQQAFGERWEAWWRQEAASDTASPAPWQPQAGAAWPQAPSGLGDWKTWGAPALQDFNGMLWLRATADLTAAQAKQDATLSLGSIDEVDQTWINGDVVGNTFGYGTPRTYPIPARQLQEGENVVVVNVLNTYGSGGLVGDSTERALVMAEGERVPLETWRYQQVPAERGLPPRAPWEAVSGLTTIHNAMVAPLHGYGLKAVLWYQGESDTGTPDPYQRKLEALMAQWRAQFGADLPVLVVQLANYGPPPTAPTESGWAAVREAQRQAARGDSLAGLAVTIDIGSPYDIHPANKQEVGRRLARAARHVVYGEAVTPSGPVPARAQRQGEQVVVSFEDIAGSLVAYSTNSPTGFELCGEARGSCRYADAQIDGRRVVLQAEAGLDATRVRYCWADSPVCTLYDEAGLPAGPFEVRISPRQ